MDRIEWTKKSWDHYKLIINIYDNHDNAKDALKGTTGVNLHS